MELRDLYDKNTNLNQDQLSCFVKACEYINNM